MTAGFDKPLYVLPFDHRGTFQKSMFGWTGELTDEQAARIAAMKQVIYYIARRYRQWVNIFEEASATTVETSRRGAKIWLFSQASG